MKFFSRLIIFLVIIAALGYGYIWYKNKQAVDDIFEKISFFVPSSYQSTTVSLTGKSVTTGIKFTIPNSAIDISIDEFQVGAGNLLDSFRLVSGLEAKSLEDMPDEFNITIKNFKVPFSASLDSNNSQPADLFTQMQLAGCKGVNHLQMSDLQAMGYQQMEGDFDIDFRFDKFVNQLSIDMYSSAKDFGSYKANILLDKVNFQMPNPQFKSFTIESSSDGFTSRLNQYCAQQADVTAEQYVERHMAYLQHLMYNKGLFLSSEFYQKYQDYVQNPRTIKISAFPDKALLTTDFLASSPQLLISRLNMQLAINNQPIHQLLGNRPDPTSLPALDEVKKEVEEVTMIQGLTLQATDPKQLANYVGYDIYFSYRGKKFKGVIDSASTNSARVNTYISSGNQLQMPFNTAEMRNVQVRREFVPPSAEQP